jgi:hypothetical protein
MLSIYAHLTCDQKRAKLNGLVCVYERLVAGDKEASITDDETGSVSYADADTDRLERLIAALQQDIAQCCGGNRAGIRRAIGISYGG